MKWDRCQTFTKSIKSIIKFAYDPGWKVVKNLADNLNIWELNPGVFIQG